MSALSLSDDESVLFREGLKSEQPGLHVAEMSKILGRCSSCSHFPNVAFTPRRWASMDEQSREKYETLAAEAKAR